MPAAFPEGSGGAPSLISRARHLDFGGGGTYVSAKRSARTPADILRDLRPPTASAASAAASRATRFASLSAASRAARSSALSAAQRHARTRAAPADTASCYDCTTPLLLLCHMPPPPPLPLPLPPAPAPAQRSMPRLRLQRPRSCASNVLPSLSSCSSARVQKVALRRANAASACSTSWRKRCGRR